MNMTTGHKHIEIAYLVIAHEDPAQLARQAKKLTEDADVYIHINKRVAIEPFQDMIEGLQTKGRIYFSKHRYKVFWGGYSILKVTLSLLEQAFENKNYDRIVLLTGLDYPVKATEQIQRFFFDNKDIDFITTHKLDRKELTELSYMQCRDNSILQFFFTSLKKYMPNCSVIRKKGFIKYHGIKYRGKIYKLYGIAPKWALKRESAKYILNFSKKNPSFNRAFRFILAPDDFYFATVLNNSKRKNNVEDSELFYIKWLPYNKGAKDLNSEDLEELKQTKALFAKKFRTGVSEELLRKLGD